MSVRESVIVLCLRDSGHKGASRLGVSDWFHDRGMCIFQIRLGRALFLRCLGTQEINDLRDTLARERQDRELKASKALIEKTRQQPHSDVDAPTANGGAHNRQSGESVGRAASTQTDAHPSESAWQQRQHTQAACICEKQRCEEQLGDHFRDYPKPLSEDVLAAPMPSLHAAEALHPQSTLKPHAEALMRARALVDRWTIHLEGES